jgi:hypothetical protein
MTDLFGTDYTLPPKPNTAHESGYQFFKRQQHYRKPDGIKKCKNCQHRVSGRYNTKMLHKCELMGLSHSEASDIRVNNVCDKHIPV